MPLPGGAVKRAFTGGFDLFDGKGLATLRQDNVELDAGHGVRPAKTHANEIQEWDLGAGRVWTAATVLEQIPGWIADYDAVAPHSALGYQSPQQYRSTTLPVGLTC